MRDEETKLRIQLLKLQQKSLLARYEARKKRISFVKTNSKLLSQLSTDGWPRTRDMKDYPKWLDIVIRAKIKGIYSIGTANCDVILMINRIYQDIKNQIIK